jgi:hypothetical protein
MFDVSPMYSGRIFEPALRPPREILKYFISGRGKLGEGRMDSDSVMLK